MPAKKTHGQTNTRLYRTWIRMKERCYSKSYESYLNYGGRGIIVCGEWKNNFSEFEKWALLNGYDESLTIDRIDVNGNYEPSNCRWCNAKEQARNRRNNVLITFNGATKCLSEFAEEYGLSLNALKNRLNRGWSIENALTTPIKHRRM